MNYAIINNVAQYIPVHENYKIKALCDVYEIPHEAVEEIGINDEVLADVSNELLNEYRTLAEERLNATNRQLEMSYRDGFWNARRKEDRWINKVYKFKYDDYTLHLCAFCAKILVVDERWCDLFDDCDLVNVKCCRHERREKEMLNANKSVTKLILNYF